jgi:hypothetical protein
VGDEAYEAAFATGRSLSLDDALALVERSVAAGAAAPG